MAGPPFDIPSRPQRRYPYSGGVEYEGETVFRLHPSPERADDDLQALVESVVDDESYTYGDWLDLPMPLYLVHDRDTGDVFRVVVRDGAIELHVLPGTESPGLRRFYEELTARSDAQWTGTWRVESA